MRTIVKTVFMCAAFAAVFTACKKDEKVNAPDSLVNTSWLYETGETKLVDGVEVGVAIEVNFKTAKEGNVAIIIGAESNDEIAVAGFKAGNFTYSYAKPKVTITIDGEKETGTIDGDKLTIDGTVYVKEKE